METKHPSTYVKYFDIFHHIYLLLGIGYAYLKINPNISSS
jgi:hypothetical protein